jgi:hypothetical protein
MGSNELETAAEAYYLYKIGYGPRPTFKRCAGVRAAQQMVGNDAYLESENAACCDAYLNSMGSIHWLEPYRYKNFAYWSEWAGGATPYGERPFVYQDSNASALVSEILIELSL